MNFLERDRI